MTVLKEIIDGFHMKANEHYNPSMDGRRDARMEGRKEVYLDCANILEKWRNSIDEEKLDELAKEYCPLYDDGGTCVMHMKIREAFKAGYRKAMED